MAPRVWFITGTSTGLGRAFAELLLTKGENVVATARKPETLDDLKTKYSSQLLTLKLDTDKPQEIKDAFAHAKAKFGRIDVVFNNAGRGLMGEVEATPEDEARKIFDTNFWGATNVSREAVRFFREENKPGGGLLLVNSSQSGVRALPVIGYYSASKHALEGVTQALAMELDPAWNIKIVIIETGSFHTAGVGKLGAGFSHPAYAAPTLPSHGLRSLITGSQRLGADPVKGVQRLYDLSLLPDPPFRFVLGKDAASFIRGELKEIEQDVNKYESWSEGLEFDD